MFNKFYEDELNYLRELGREFAEANPAHAHMLGGKGGDPDVERLLEGFAFLTGRLRQKLDDDFPELTHTMMRLLFPHFLRPVPSATIIRFEPAADTLRSRTVVEKGAFMDSHPVEGTPCRFRTAADTVLYPLKLTDAALEEPAGRPPCLRIELKVDSGNSLKQLDLSDLRLHFRGEDGTDYDLHLWMSRYVKSWRVFPEGEWPKGNGIAMDVRDIRPAGFTPEEALLPYPPHAFQGYRILQEYFALPEKFLMVDLFGLERAAQLETDGLTLIFEFSRPPEINRRIGPENIMLYCAPAVNLFPHEGDPLRVEQERFEYTVRPSGRDPGHYKVHSVDKVGGFMPGTAESREYKPFFSFRHAMHQEDREMLYYHPTLRPSLAEDDTELSISFINVDQEGMIPPTEIVSLELTCSNGRLAEKLRPGDVSRPTQGSPEFALFENIGRVTRAAPPPLGRDIYWMLMSHWSLNYNSIATVESLRSLIALYNFHALHDRQAARENDLKMGAVLKADTTPEERFLHGVPVRGLAVDLEIKEENFACEGELHLFAAVLAEFMTLYASMNSFVRFTAHGAEHRETYTWPPRAGDRILL